MKHLSNDDQQRKRTVLQTVVRGTNVIETKRTNLKSGSKLPLPNPSHTAILQRAVGNQTLKHCVQIDQRIHRQSVPTPQSATPIRESTTPVAGLPSFSVMWSNYPTGTPEDVKKLIGGQVDRDWIKNTCAIRMSRVFNYSGIPIPNRHSGLHTIRGADRMRYAFRVREFKNYLLRKYGRSTLQYDNRRSEARIPENMRNKRGILVFTVDGWADASGHITLWDGDNCVDHCYWGEAKKVELWVAQ